MEGLSQNLNHAFNNEESPGFTRSKRVAPPAHYTLKIESFSKLSEILKKTGLEKYESDQFESGNYKWKLVLYPFGNAKKDGSDHISLYIAIAEANINIIPAGSQVDVILKFFVYDQIRDNYLTIQDCRMRRYHSFNTENGFDQLISLKMFNDSSNGYLVDDCCIFGAEVHVIKYEGKGEKFSIIKEPENGTFTWKIGTFSTLSEGKQLSQEFTVSQHKWQLQLYPKGDSRSSGKSLAIFLCLLTNNAHPQRRVYAESKLIVKDQVKQSHHKHTVNNWFISNSNIDSWGFSDFMPLNDIYNASKGFLVNDTLIVEVKISLLSAFEGLSYKYQCTKYELKALSTIHTSSSIGPKRLGTNKRSWTFDEESKLIETLIELHNSGRFKAERDFKAEHFKAVEDILQVKLPGHGIKAKPHIESKLKTLRNHFDVVHDMLAGNSCSGFSWDSDRKCVTAENAVWEEYLKSHQDAKPFRFKAFSFYEELCIVFGKDRATGKNAEAPAGILEELKNETPTGILEELKNEAPIVNDVNENITADQNESSIFFKTNEESSKQKKNKSENIASFSKVIKESVTILGMEIGKATDRLSRALKDSDANDKRLMINNELTKLYGLTMFERHKATRKIGCNRETTDIFFTIPDDEKEIWVKALLNGDI